MGERLTGRLFDIQRFSVHDGPGIRTTLFLKGCPLRCPWCHSPESWKFEAEQDRAGEKTIGADYTVDEAVRLVRREMPFYKRTGGGVTISGGECLCQPEFVLEALKRCKGEGIHTAVDTSGHAPWEAFEAILPYTDLFLYDLKGVDCGLHERVVGVPNGLILDNARRIAEAGGKFQIRLPLIPMYSDSAEAFEGMGRFILELGGAVEAVQILPYHNLGTEKWRRLQTGKGGVIFEAAPPSGALVAERKKQLEDMGLNVIVG